MEYKFSFFIIFCFCACSISRKASVADKELLTKVYANQKLYLDTSIRNTSDFVGIINFGKKGRFDLYGQNSVIPSKFDTCIILEGIANGWGKYVGLFIGHDRVFFYKNKPHSSWECAWINIGDKESEAMTGLSERVIDKIRDWDIGYINSLKNKIGAYVYDGFSFIATRVINSKSNHPVIESISFYEFR